MNQITRGVLALLALCIVLLAPQAAAAATREAAISVSAEVVDTCSITVSRVATSGDARCSLETPYSVVTRKILSTDDAAAGTAERMNLTPAHTGSQASNNQAMLMTITF